MGVIYGGRSGEHEVSLMSARSVLAALSPDRYIVTEIAITHAGAWVTGDNLLKSMVEGISLLPEAGRAAARPHPAGRVRHARC